jgi:hypothetical protein
MDKIAINGLTINYDIDSMLNKLKTWEYDEDEYSGRGEGHQIDNYKVSEKDWETAKVKFIKEIEDLKQEEKLVNVINRITRNKNGNITKNRKNKLISCDAVRDYSGEHGSHAYTIDCISIIRNTDVEATMVVTSCREQSSF